MSATKTRRVLRLKMKTTSPTNPSAAAPQPTPRPTPEPLIVFELLELILLHLPMRDLLLAQRVNKRWASVIRMSPPIQRALFFQPICLPTDPSLSLPRAILRSVYTTNPLLNAAFMDCMRIMGIIFDSKVHIVPAATSEKAAGYPHTTGVALDSFPPGQRWEDRFRYQEASWRRMLLTQPPTEMVCMDDRRIAPDYDDCFNEHAKNPMGARMGDVLDLEEVDLPIEA